MDTPNFIKLFGDIDFRSGDEARSVYSPGAYLVDLLQLLDDEIQQGSRSDSSAARLKTAREVTLNSENTYELLPYLDIVNERLEAELDGDEYARIRDSAYYPFNLPFDLDNERVKLYLKYLDVSAERLHKAFESQGAEFFALNYNKEFVAREYLGLSVGLATLLIALEPTSPPQGAELDRIKDSLYGGKLPKMGHADGVLVDDFILATGISYEEFDQLLKQDLSEMELSSDNPLRPRADFYVNNYESSSGWMDVGKASHSDEDSGLRLLWKTGSSESLLIDGRWFDRASRFIRLAKHSELSFAELDLIVRSCCASKIDSYALQVIALVQSARSKHDLDVDSVCTLLSTMDNVGYGKDDEPADLFNRTFNGSCVFVEKRFIGNYKLNPVSGNGERLLPEQYSGLSRFEFSGDILALENKPYRKRIAHGLGLSEKDLVLAVRGFRDRNNQDIQDEAAHDSLWSQVSSEDEALMTLYRSKKLMSLLDTSIEDLFILLDVLEKDPLARQTLHPGVFLDSEIDSKSPYDILRAGTVNERLWLLQTLVSLNTWMSDSGLTAEELLQLTSGSFVRDLKHYSESEDKPVDNAQGMAAKEKIKTLDKLYQTVKPQLLTESSFVMEPFDQRFSRKLHAMVSEKTNILVAQQDKRLLRLDEAALETCAFSAIKQVDMISRDDFLNMGVSEKVQDKIFENLVLFGVIDTQGQIIEDALPEDVDDFYIETNFNSLKKGLFEHIAELQANYIDTGFFPADLDFLELNHKAREELYNNLIFNGFISEEGSLLQGPTFETEFSYHLFEVNSGISEYANEIFQTLSMRRVVFESEEIRIHEEIFSELDLSQQDLIENLRFNGYIDDYGVLVDNAAMLLLDDKTLLLDLPFYPLRHRILTALQYHIRNQKMKHYRVEKSLFEEVADKLIADLTYEVISRNYLNDGRITEKHKAYFRDEGNKDDLDISWLFSANDNSAVFERMKSIVAASERYHLSNGSLADLDFSPGKAKELFDLMKTEGYLTSEYKIPEEKIDYFLNINKALEIDLKVFKDYNKDVFFILHELAKHIDSDVKAIVKHFTMLDKSLDMAVFTSLQSVFGLESEALAKLSSLVFETEQNLREQYLLPVLATVNKHDKVDREPQSSVFNTAYKRVQEFSRFAVRLKLDKDEIALAFRDQDLVEKFPESIELPKIKVNGAEQSVTHFDALLESRGGYIYLFKNPVSSDTNDYARYFLYSSVTHQRIVTDDDKLISLLMGRTDAPTDNTMKVNAAFVDRENNDVLIVDGKYYFRSAVDAVAEEMRLEKKEQWNRLSDDALPGMYIDEERPTPMPWQIRKRQWGKRDTQFDKLNQVSAAFTDSSKRSYLISNEQYIRFSPAQNGVGNSLSQVDENYPKNLAGGWQDEAHFEAMNESFSTSLDAAFHGSDNTTYYFSDGEFVSSNNPGEVQQTNEHWGRIKNTLNKTGEVDACYTDSGLLYIISGEQIFAYRDSIENDDVTVMEGYPKTLSSHFGERLPGLFHSGIKAACKGRDNKIWLFKEEHTIGFSFDGSAITDTNIQVIQTEEYWGKVDNPICDGRAIDAALSAADGRLYLFCGTQYYRYSSDDYSQVDPGYPKNISEDWGSFVSIRAAFVLDGKTFLFGKPLMLEAMPMTRYLNAVKELYAYTALSGSESPDEKATIVAFKQKIDAFATSYTAIEDGLNAERALSIEEAREFYGAEGEDRTTTVLWSVLGNLIGALTSFIESQSSSSDVSVAIQVLQVLADLKLSMDTRAEKSSYIRYSCNDYSEVDEGYPKLQVDTDQNWWNLPEAVRQGGGFVDVDAVFNAPDGKTYLFSGNQFIYFDSGQRWWSEPRTITELWPDLTFSRVNAAFSGKDGKTYIFYNEEYARFSGSDYCKLDNGYPRYNKHYWGNIRNNLLESGKVDSCLVVASYEAKDNSAAGASGRGKETFHTYLFCGNQFFRYAEDDYVLAEPGYPKPLEELKYEPRFKALMEMEDYPFTAAFADKWNIYLIGNKGVKVLSDKTFAKQHNAATFGNIDCALIENGAIYIRHQALTGSSSASPDWRHLSSPEFDTPVLTDDEKPLLLFSPEAPVQGEISAVLQGIDGNTYFFTDGKRYWDKQLNRSYSLDDKWGRVRNHIRDQNEVSAAFVGRDGKTYIFGGDQYVIYDEMGYKQDQGSSPPIPATVYQELESSPAVNLVEQDWPGLKRVDIAYVQGEKTYLLERIGNSGRFKYLCYVTDNYAEEELDDPEETDIEFWGMPQYYLDKGWSNFDAVLVEPSGHTHQQTLLFIKGREFIQYSVENDTWLKPESLDKLWPSLPCDHHIFDELSCVFIGIDNVAYFFGDECYVSYTQGTMGSAGQFSTDMPIESQWAHVYNAFAEQVDAAVLCNSGQTFLFSQNKYVRYSGYDYCNVDAGYPKLITENLRQEASFRNLPPEFEVDFATQKVAGKAIEINAVIDNGACTMIFMGENCYTSRADRSRYYPLTLLGQLRNNIAESGKVDAAFVLTQADGSKESTTYLFSGDQYYRYSKRTNRYRYVDEGYPKRITTSLTKDLGITTKILERFTSGIDAAIVANESDIFLFKDREFLRIGDADALIIKDRWKKPQNSFEAGGTIDGGFVDGEDRLYLFSGDSYIRYSDTEQDYIEAEYPKMLDSNFRGFPTDYTQGIDGAFTLAGKTYFVKGASGSISKPSYIRFSQQDYECDKDSKLKTRLAQAFEDRWGSWTDYHLRDLQVIQRFKDIDRRSGGDLRLVDLFVKDKMAVKEPYAGLAEKFNWDIDELKWLKRNQAFLQMRDDIDNPLVDQEHLFSLELINRMVDVFNLADKLNIDVKTLYQDIWQKLYDPAYTAARVSGEANREAADAMIATLGARHCGSADYEVLTKEIHNKLNLIKRDALLSYSIHKASNVQDSGIEDARDLYDRMLVDVEMGECAETSKIKQAIAAVQLYFHRYFMSLEGEELKDNTRLKALKERWHWMRNYRVWEANRKVFLYPENYIRPELRDTKSPEFTTFEEELLQGEITDELVSNAYLKFLTSFTQVSSLSIEGGYVYRDDDNSEEKKLVLFGRSKMNPPQYYYRTASFDDDNIESASWQPWQDTRLNIEVERVYPVHAFGRHYLFWATVELEDKGDGETVLVSEKNVTTPKTLPGGEPKHVVSIFYSHQDLNQQWITPQKLDTGIKLPTKIDNFSLKLERVASSPGQEEELQIHCFYNEKKFDYELRRFSFFSWSYEYPVPIVRHIPNYISYIFTNKLGLKRKNNATKFEPELDQATFNSLVPKRGHSAYSVRGFDTDQSLGQEKWFGFDFKGGSALCRPLLGSVMPPVQSDSEFSELPDQKSEGFREISSRIDAAVHWGGKSYFFNNQNAAYISSGHNKILKSQNFGRVKNSISISGQVDWAYLYQGVLYLSHAQKFLSYGDNLNGLDWNIPTILTENLPLAERIAGASSGETSENSLRADQEQSVVEGLGSLTTALAIEHLNSEMSRSYFFSGDNYRVINDSSGEVLVKKGSLSDWGETHYRSPGVEFIDAAFVYNDFTYIFNGFADSGSHKNSEYKFIRYGEPSKGIYQDHHSGYPKLNTLENVLEELGYNVSSDATDYSNMVIRGATDGLDSNGEAFVDFVVKITGEKSRQHFRYDGATVSKLASDVAYKHGGIMSGTVRMEFGPGRDGKDGSVRYTIGNDDVKEKLIDPAINACFIDKDKYVHLFSDSDYKMFPSEGKSGRALVDLVLLQIKDSWSGIIKDTWWVKNNIKSGVGVDAALNRGDKVYLFSGDQYYRYSDFLSNTDPKDIKVDDGYPKLIKGNTEAIPQWDKISATFEYPPRVYQSHDSVNDRKVFYFNNAKKEFVVVDELGVESRRHKTAKVWGLVKNNFTETGIIDSAYVIGSGENKNLILTSGNEYITYTSSLRLGQSNGYIGQSYNDDSAKVTEIDYLQFPPDLRVEAAFHYQDFTYVISRDKVLKYAKSEHSLFGSWQAFDGRLGALMQAMGEPPIASLYENVQIDSVYIGDDYYHLFRAYRRNSLIISVSDNSKYVLVYNLETKEIRRSDNFRWANSAFVNRDQHIQVTEDSAYDAALVVNIGAATNPWHFCCFKGNQFIEVKGNRDRMPLYFSDIGSSSKDYWKGAKNINEYFPLAKIDGAYALPEYFSSSDCHGPTESTSRGESTYFFSGDNYEIFDGAVEPSFIPRNKVTESNFSNIPHDFTSDISACLFIEAGESTSEDDVLYFIKNRNPGSGFNFIRYTTPKSERNQEHLPLLASEVKYDIIRLSSSVGHELSERMLRGNIDDLLSLPAQEINETPAFVREGSSGSGVTEIVYSRGRVCKGPANTHLEFNGANGLFYWELFYHAPSLIAQSLNASQKFEEAKRWYEYIFDPTENGNYWQFLPFVAVELKSIELRLMAIRDLLPMAGQTKLDNLVDSQDGRLLQYKNALAGFEAMSKVDRVNFDKLAEGTWPEFKQALSAVNALAASNQDPALRENINSALETFELIKELPRRYRSLLKVEAAQLKPYLNDPFDPHAIARLRRVAYRRRTVMAYIDNLIDWGDMLFRQYTHESINEARMLYVLAYDLLGKKPKSHGERDLSKGHSYEDIKDYGADDGQNAYDFLFDIPPVISLASKNAGENQAPSVASQISVEVKDNSGVHEIDLLSFVSDSDGDNLSVDHTTVRFSNRKGMLFFEESGLFIDTKEYDLKKDETESVTIDFDLVDGMGGRVSQSARIVLVGAEDAVKVDGVIAVEFAESSGDHFVELLPAQSKQIKSGSITRTQGDDKGITVHADSQLVVNTVVYELDEGISETVSYDYVAISKDDMEVPHTVNVTIQGRVDGVGVSADIHIRIRENTGIRRIDLLASEPNPVEGDLILGNIALIRGDGQGVTVQHDNIVVNPNVYSLRPGETADIEYSYTVGNSLTGNPGLIRNIVISILGEDDRPSVSSAISMTVVEGNGQHKVDLLQFAKDEEGANLQVVGLTLVVGDASKVVDNKDGTLSIDTDAFNLDWGQTERIVYRYRVSDGNSQSSETTATVEISGQGASFSHTGIVHESVANPYFYVPENSQVLDYWERIDDRLYKIRHCLNIMGVSQPLPLFQPPVDPMALVNAVAGGGGISAALAGMNITIPHYRFRFMLAKAQELTAKLKQLGGDLQNALEKKDAEELSLLHNRQEELVLNITREIKAAQINEAKAHLEFLEESKKRAEYQQTTYNTLGNSEMIDDEKAQVRSLQIAAGMFFSISPLKFVGAALKAVGEIKAGLDAGPNVGARFAGEAIMGAADALEPLAEGFSMEGEISGIHAQHERSKQDWLIQEQMAIHETEQLKRQITGAEWQIRSAELELDAHEKQIEHNQSIATYMKGKFSNKQLYQWISGKLSALYFQTYKMAHDLGKAAEQSYRFERGLPTSEVNFIGGSYWDNQKKGLLSGERLGLDLDRMETSYLESDARRFEITKTISLAALDPMALLTLKSKRMCEFNFSEALFDYDFPGHYNRQVKSISIKLNAGESRIVNATLSQLSNKLVLKPDVKAVKYLMQPKDSEPTTIRSDWRSNQQIAVSKVDSYTESSSGLFELNFNDDRYLPFEGTGAISSWRLELNGTKGAYAIGDLRDVEIDLRYTALSGGKPFTDVVKGLLKPYDSAVHFDMAENFPDVFFPFIYGDTDTLDIAVLPEMFPNIAGSKITAVYAFFETEDGSDISVIMNDNTELNLRNNKLLFTNTLVVGSEGSDWSFKAKGDKAKLKNMGLVFSYKASVE